ncbi:membrane protein DedA with SNARE-associated domain [Nocardia transvalensis]|uniref:Membrane protein DedA with SNARE-associated domain n=1 Tax=Nocardia transvalensis TaxID=37333 RepID=A0A7W9UK98_9NOCA|nr:DedA family protein [Nocardia transvalensis]MBB5916112.1 membrane protein DedA with SNARE-associated domain [Nocardia transvalensis]
MNSVLHRILDVAPVWVYLVVTALVFAEDAIFVGFVIPGETAAVLGGVAASQGHVLLWAMIAVVIAAAIVGDSVGYEVGKHVGPRLLGASILDRHRGRLDRAQDFLARRGGWAVFLGRFTAFFRAVMPALAGTSRMPYRRFLAFNAVGGIVWGATFVTLGFVAGQSYEAVAKTVGRGMAIAVVAIIVIALIVWKVRERRHDRTLEVEYQAAHDPDRG